MNIYDCFMYCGEDMLLDIRLNVLDKYVKSLSSQKLIINIMVVKKN